jgi:serine protease Do
MPHENPLLTPKMRNRILTSAAVLALVAGGAIGEIELAGAPAAHAAAVTTSDVQPGIPSFAPLIERVKPAVVSVQVKFLRQNASSEQLGKLPPDIQRFFRQFGDNVPAKPQTVMIGEGSGFFISSDGYIVTNNHVAQNAKSVTVTMDNGKVLDAKVIGTDPKTDLALLKVDQPGDYPFVTFAKQEPKIGDWVVAIGNPYDLGGTVTAGIVSAKGRDIGDGPYDRFLQIDAPINKGNSGGPTFNEQGQVVGVNTAIYSPSGGSIGIGFDIPASTVERVVTALEHGGVVERGYLGVEVQPVRPNMAEALGLKSAAGAIVDETMPGTPAASAGLKPGDVITKVNGNEVKDASDLTRMLGLMKPGAKVELSYLRDGAEKTAAVTLAAQKVEKAARAESVPAKPTTALGLRLAPATEVDGAGQKGVAVVGVDPGGRAAQEGFTAGDIILDVGGKPVSTPDQVKSGIASAHKDGKKAVMMRVQTANGARFVAFAFPKA